MGNQTNFLNDLDSRHSTEKKTEKKTDTRYIAYAHTMGGQGGKGWAKKHVYPAHCNKHNKRSKKKDCPSANDRRFRSTNDRRFRSTNYREEGIVCVPTGQRSLKRIVGFKSANDRKTRTVGLLDSGRPTITKKRFVRCRSVNDIQTNDQ